MGKNNNIETTSFSNPYGLFYIFDDPFAHKKTSGSTGLDTIEKILNRSLAYLKDGFLYLYNGYQLNKELKSKGVSLKLTGNKKEKTLWTTFTTGLATALPFLERTKRYDSALLKSSDVLEY